MYCTFVRVKFSKNYAHLFDRERSGSCSDTPVGVRDELKVIPDDYMTASSVLPGFPAKDGRLAGTGAWCPLTNGSDAVITNLTTSKLMSIPFAFDFLGCLLTTDCY